MRLLDLLSLVLVFLRSGRGERFPQLLIRFVGLLVVRAD